MVINVDEAKLRNVAQLQEFLRVAQDISFRDVDGDNLARSYEHIRRGFMRLFYAGLSKIERGVLLAYRMRTNAYCSAVVIYLAGVGSQIRRAAEAIATKTRGTKSTCGH